SSRRRHTRCLSDWSSDVCSSDLPFRVGRLRFEAINAEGPQRKRRIGEETTLRRRTIGDGGPGTVGGLADRQEFNQPISSLVGLRSEERRVGKECRDRWWRQHCKK